MRQMPTKRLSLHRKPCLAGSRSMESLCCASRTLRRLENSSTKRSDPVLTADWRPLVWPSPTLPKGIRQLHSVVSRRWRLLTAPSFVRAFRFSRAA